MQSLFDAAADLLHIWSINFVFDVGRYAIAAGAMAAILALFWRAGLSRRKIQARLASSADIRREILTSLRTTFVFSLVGVGVYLGAVSGVDRKSVV